MLEDTVIFVVEDDTQNGLDHVDGYRSIFLAISPWVKRENVTQAAPQPGEHLQDRRSIFGMPPLNQYDAAATDLRELFTADPDFTAYDFVQPVFVAQAKPSWKRLTRHRLPQPDPDEVELRLAIMKSEGLPHRTRARRARTVTTLLPAPAPARAAVALSLPERLPQ